MESYKQSQVTYIKEIRCEIEHHKQQSIHDKKMIELHKISMELSKKRIQHAKIQLASAILTLKKYTNGTSRKKSI